MRKVEILVIGAGPHALSLAVRLTCNKPWDECFLDVNNNRRDFTSTKENSESFNLNDLLVIDQTGEWLSTWKNNFNTLEIAHLRSSILVHTDAYDSLSLLEYVEKENETKNLPNVFDSLKVKVHKQKRDKKKSRMNGTRNPFNEAQRKFFTIPSSKLFIEHADWLVEKHSLQNVLKKASVSSVEYRGAEFDYPMLVHLTNGESIEAKNVVYSGNEAVNRIPKWATNYIGTQNVYHSSEICKLKSTINSESKKILIVGGGLSALHASIAAVKKGHKVTVVARSPLKVRQFDIPPIWMSPLRNNEFSKFYALSIEDRYNLIKSTRGGGSVTPEIYKKFQKEVKNNRISFLEGFSVTNITNEEGGIHVNMTCITSQSTNDGIYDVIVLGTGREYSLNCDSKSLISNIFKRYPIPTQNGLPILNSSLKWNDDIPFYVMGAYASLEIGPDALNLMGGRMAASRIVPDLQTSDNHEDHDCNEETHHSLTSIHVCNRFSSLLSVE